MTERNKVGKEEIKKGKKGGKKKEKARVRKRVREKGIRCMARKNLETWLLDWKKYKDQAWI